MLAGSVEISESSRTAVLKFQEDRVVVHFPDLRSARRFRAVKLAAPDLIAKALSMNGTDLYAAVGRRRPRQLYPRPGWLIRWFSPQVRRLLAAAPPPESGRFDP
jgi:hypothetical protein